MKKNSIKKVMAILATATMMISAAGMTAAGAEREEEIVSYSYDRYAAAETISLQGANAKPGETVEVPIILTTGNQCTAFDVVVEYDSRLEFVGVDGAKMYNEFEEGGRKFVSVINYDLDPFADGEAATTIKLRVPEVAENDNYTVRFENISSFSNEYEDFANYSSEDAYITVTGGFQREDSMSVELTSTEALAGEKAEVKVVPTANNQCSNYEMLLEYDSRLTLEDEDVNGANTSCIFEEDGKCFVSLIGYTTSTYADGEAMATLNFQVPEDAIDGEEFYVNIVQVSNLGTELYSFDKYTTTNAAITASSGCKGDANVDGKADVRDAALIARVCANPNAKDQITEKGEKLGDVDANSKLNVRDAAKIARYVSNGKISWD